MAPTPVTTPSETKPKRQVPKSGSMPQHGSVWSISSTFICLDLQSRCVVIWQPGTTSTHEHTKKTSQKHSNGLHLTTLLTVLAFLEVNSKKPRRKPHSTWMRSSRTCWSKAQHRAMVGLSSAMDVQAVPGQAGRGGFL